jgi:glycosyltransferase involved in cell wall biosynthesis
MKNNNFKGIKGICFLVPSYGIGGLEIEIIKKAQEAKQRGINSVIVCLENSSISERAKELNINVEYIKFVTPYIAPIASIKLVQIIKKHKINIVITAVTKFLAISIIAKLFFNNVKVILYQQLISGLNKRDFYHNFLYRNLDAAIVLAEYMRIHLRDSTIMNYSKTAAIPPGVEVDNFHFSNFDRTQIRKEFNIPTNKFVFGTIGRIEPLKGQIYPIKAFIEAKLENAIYVIAGNIGNQNYLKEIKDYIQDKNYSDKVFFLPFTWQIDKLHNLLDVFVMSSLCETFGYVNIEAMATGNVLIGTDAGGVREIIDNDINGILYDPIDTEQLKSIMIEVMQNEKKREFLSNNAVEKAKTTYEKDTNSDKFFNYCCDVINDNK